MKITKEKTVRFHHVGETGIINLTTDEAIYLANSFDRFTAENAEMISAARVTAFLAALANGLHECALKENQKKHGLCYTIIRVF